MSQAWPIGGLPEGTDYTVWLRAASLGGTTVRELLQDTLPVQGVAYQRALEDIALDVAQAASIPTDPARWDLHMTAESTITRALRHMQDNEVAECMVLLVQAASQVFEVVRMDRNDQIEEGQL